MRGRPGALGVSPNGHYFQTSDGEPFFYQGDTAWEIFYRATREDVDLYLNDRASKGFNVVQAVGIGEFGGPLGENAYGHPPLEIKILNGERTASALTLGSEDFWTHVDYVVEKAAALGVYIAFVPTWGRYWVSYKPADRVFSLSSIRQYGQFLGTRYRDADNIMWILGANVEADAAEDQEIVRALASGLREAGGKTTDDLPFVGRRSVERRRPAIFGEFLSSGSLGRFQHATVRARTGVQSIASSQKLHTWPRCRRPVQRSHARAGEARRGRRAALRRSPNRLLSDRIRYIDRFRYSATALLDAISGLQPAIRTVITPYGSFFKKGAPPVNDPVTNWRDSLRAPGAGQIQHARRLLESRPYFTRIPDDSVIVPDQQTKGRVVPGAGTKRFVATRDSNGRYIMVYVPTGRTFVVDVSSLKCESIAAWWFDPRTGSAESLGVFGAAERLTFISPSPGEDVDYVLVLDDVSCAFAPPGHQNL